jgi:hypothetical protein
VAGGKPPTLLGPPRWGVGVVRCSPSAPQLQ